MTWRVEGEESVTVPAGSFTTVRISQRIQRSGRLVTEMWYCPALGQYVRLNQHSRQTDHQLIAFQIQR